MATKNLFLDESGFTGSDLLNPDQPQFCVASTTIDDDHALAMLQQSFPKYGGDEFKFRPIWRRGTHRRGLIELGKLLGPVADDIFVYRIDKKFCALTKLVDFLVEPPAHAAGFNFYANGYAPRYCNMWYFGIQLFASPSLYNVTVEQYQAFARDPTEASLNRLQTWLHIAAASVPEQLKPFYNMAALGADTFLQFHDLEQHRGSSEVQFTTVLQCISHWRLKLEGDLAVFHDASSNFFRSTEMWERITGTNVPDQRHIAADGSMNEFPLRVIQTEAVDSAQSPAIQLCDVIAGLSAKVCRRREEDLAFLTEVSDAGLGEILIGGIRPEPELPNGEPAQLDGPDVVDMLTQIMFGPR